MPEVTYRTVMNLPVSTIWDFVQDMDHWAPMLTGYVSHEKRSDTESTWRLRGDVGVLSREVELAVVITEWVDQERVRFTLTGVNEAVEGGGLFEMAPYAPGDAAAGGGSVNAAASGGSVDAAAGGGSVNAAAGGGSEGGAASVPAVVEAPRPGPWKRFVRWLFRALFRRKYGTVGREALTAEEIGPTAASLSFTLRMDAGGPTGPLVNAMLEPALLPAAEDLGDKIAAHLEQVHGRKGEEAA